MSPSDRDDTAGTTVRLSDRSPDAVASTGAGWIRGAVAGSWLPVVPSPRALQIGWDPHVAAVAGLLALVFLGCVLVVRNRLEEDGPLATDRDSQPEEYVTDRERIRQLIGDNGGRMRQSKIVDSVDWSKAKVSRLLAQLEEDGQVTKLRLGRENLVCLPGYEPSASKSPEQSSNEPNSQD